MTAYVFPGQGAQFTGMGKDLYEASPKAKALIDSACDILGFDIRNIMFNGSADDLKQTKVTQPAVFIHSVAAAAVIEDFHPGMTAGHSLGEFSALVAAGAMSFEDGLRLVYARAMAMQKACEAHPSTMAAIIGLPDDVVEKVCEDIKGVVVPANYNCPGQLVISGEIEAVDEACAVLKEARRGYQQDGHQGSRMPRISECGCPALHRSGSNQGEAPEAAHITGKMDSDSAQHAP